MPLLARFLRLAGGHRAKKYTIHTIGVHLIFDMLLCVLAAFARFQERNFDQPATEAELLHFQKITRQFVIDRAPDEVNIRCFMLLH